MVSKYPERGPAAARIALSLLAYNCSSEHLDATESTLAHLAEIDPDDEDHAAALNELLIARQGENFEHEDRP